MSEPGRLIVRYLKEQPYFETWQRMRTWTQSRCDNTLDEIWFLEHTACFTQGLAGKTEHQLTELSAPLVLSDRGGQITYHGPGQLIIYPLIDLRKKKFGVSGLVSRLEQSLIDYLKTFEINAAARTDARGIYVHDHKIASIGLRVSKGCSFHGMAFNVKMDLSPFQQINPCGLTTIQMTQLSNWVESTPSMEKIIQQLMVYLAKHLAYDMQSIRHDGILNL